MATDSKDDLYLTDQSVKMEVDQTEEPISNIAKETHKLENAVSGPSLEEVSQIQPVPSQTSSASFPVSFLTVKVKDEPADEELEQPMAPQALASSLQVKPETPEECGEQQKALDELKISAVFSVEPWSSAPVGLTPAQPAIVPAPKTVSPPYAPVSSLASASSLCLLCSGCRKVLLKGQTVYQYKGTSQLYCSAPCLTRSATVLKAVIKKTCHYCLNEIVNSKEVVIAPVDSAGAVQDFCNQKCLSAFICERDRINSDHASSKCSVCQKFCITHHEVTYMGVIHKLCGDPCFTQFCLSNKLSMNCCVNCGLYCHLGQGKSHTLKIDGTAKKLCSQSCVSIYKKKSPKLVRCTSCHLLGPEIDMVESTNSEGTQELFYSTACLTAHQVQTLRSFGTAQEYNNCNVSGVLQSSFIIPNGSVHNFCSVTCVVACKEAFNKSNISNQVNTAKVVEKWTIEEVQALLDIYSEGEIQKEFESAFRNDKVYQKISSRLNELGIQRTAKQCREKMNQMKRDYKKIKDRSNGSGPERRTNKWFNTLDTIFGRCPASSGATSIKDSAAVLLEGMTDDTRTNSQDDDVSSAEDDQPSVLILPRQPSCTDSSVSSCSPSSPSPPQALYHVRGRRKRDSGDFLEAMREMEQTNVEILRQVHEQQGRYLQLLLEQRVQRAKARARELALRQEEATDTRRQQNAFQQGFLAVLGRFVRVLDKRDGQRL